MSLNSNYVSTPKKWKGSYTEMLAFSGMQEYDEWVINSGTNVGNKYEYRGATAGWVNTDIGGAASVEPRKLAHERRQGEPDEYGVAVGEWNVYQFNPRAASIGSALGAAGAAGTTEVLVTANPVKIGGIFFESDSTGNALLRNAASTGQSLVAKSVGTGQLLDGMEFDTGLTVCGSVAGTSFTILWKDQ